MIKVAITGSMGSGKSYCVRLFAELGIPIFNSDEEVRKIQNSNQELKNKIIAQFGSVYLPNGNMDSIAVRKIVFGDTKEHKDNLKKLTEIVYPFVLCAFQKFCIDNKNQPYIIAESAILFETGFNKFFDKIIYVAADTEARIEAAIKRDGITKWEYNQRMKDQISSDIKKKNSDFILINNYTDEIIDQVTSLHYRLLELC